MDKNIKVTIGIPFYNSERYLDLSIRSVLNQTFNDFELILSDDGSTDKSLMIAQSFNDPRIVIISDNTNKGISSRLNEQIEKAKGKYFVRMDADDIMMPDRLVKQLEFLEKNGNYDVVGSHAIVINNENTILGLRKSVISNSFIKCFRYNPFIHPTVMGKTDWFKEFKYINELSGVEDADLWIRSFNKSIFFIIEEPLLFYRDPLRIKFDTYKYRFQQRQKMYRANRNLLLNLKYLIYYFKFLDYIKLEIYCLFKLFQIESILIKFRNNKLNKKMYPKATLVLNSVLRIKS